MSHQCLYSYIVTLLKFVHDLLKPVSGGRFMKKRDGETDLGSVATAPLIRFFLFERLHLSFLFLDRSEEVGHFSRSKRLGALTEEATLTSTGSSLSDSSEPSESKCTLSLVLAAMMLQLKKAAGFRPQPSSARLWSDHVAILISSVNLTYCYYCTQLT